MVVVFLSESKNCQKKKKYMCTIQVSNNVRVYKYNNVLYVHPVILLLLFFMIIKNNVNRSFLSAAVHTQSRINIISHKPYIAKSRKNRQPLVIISTRIERIMNKTIAEGCAHPSHLRVFVGVSQQCAVIGWAGRRAITTIFICNRQNG